MKPHEVESWALRVIDRVKKNQPVEDSRIELKAGWIPPGKAARRLAGHANAAGGTFILWLIGVDEEEGVVGADYAEFAAWWDQVESQFDEGFTPTLSRHLNIPVEGTTVVALLFETERAPFVVKNPAYGKKGGGPVELEVPWREGTSVRSARRADLLKLLSPLQALPSFEVIGGEFTAYEDGRGLDLHWSLSLKLYVEPANDNHVVIPFHRCKATFKMPTLTEVLEFDQVRLHPPEPSIPVWKESKVVGEFLSKTIESTQDEVLINGPGKVCLDASLRTAWMAEEHVSDEVEVQASLRPTRTDQSVLISATLSRCEPKGMERYKWKLKQDQSIVWTIDLPA